MMNKTFPAKTESLSDVISYVEQTLQSFQCPLKIQMSICVAVEEIFINIAQYAYPKSTGYMTMHISFDEKSRIITFRITDKGIHFNPLKKTDPDITLSTQEREIGGLGIFIAKKTMDSLSYTYVNNENILTMIKKI